MINIDSNQGRIGEPWWVNSDHQPIEDFVPVTIGVLDFGMVVKARLIRWGTCGYGRNIRIDIKPIEG